MHSAFFYNIFLIFCSKTIHPLLQNQTSGNRVTVSLGRILIASMVGETVLMIVVVVVVRMRGKLVLGG